MTRDGWGRLTSERRKRGEYAVAVLGSRGEAIGLFKSIDHRACGGGGSGLCLAIGVGVRMVIGRD